MKKTYSVYVDCANCANKMEAAASKIEGVKDAVMNFMAQKLIIEYSEHADADAVLDEVVKACKRVDGDFEIKK